MADPIVLEIVEDARAQAQSQHWPFDPATCEIEDETSGAQPQKPSIIH
jgi:hypothetical protein